MSVRVRLAGIDIEHDSPDDGDLVVRFSVESDFGVMEIGCRDRLTPGSSLDEAVERGRQRLIQFAKALEEAATEFAPGQDTKAS